MATLTQTMMFGLPEESVEELSRREIDRQRQRDKTTARIKKARRHLEYKKVQPDPSPVDAVRAP